MLTLPFPCPSIWSTMAGDYYSREGLIQKNDTPALEGPQYVYANHRRSADYVHLSRNLEIWVFMSDRLLLKRQQFWKKI